LKKILFLNLILIIILISGCSTKDSNSYKIIETSTTMPKMESKESDFLETFRTAFPKVEIVNKAMKDLNNDGNEDLIIIFNNPIESLKTTKSNICIVSKYGINALDLAGGDLNYQYANGANSLKFLENPTRISVMLYNISTNKTIDYQVIMNVEKENEGNKTNLIIKTIDQ